MKHSGSSWAGSAMFGDGAVLMSDDSAPAADVLGTAAATRAEIAFLNFCEASPEAVQEFLATHTVAGAACLVLRRPEGADRPEVHFTAPLNWLNDPNGLLVLDGEMHLFYQHQPHSLDWGPMHWGHAVSRDGVQWEDLPLALEAEGPGMLGAMWSGCTVYDRHNTAGLAELDRQTGELKVPMVAVFTIDDGPGERNQRQCLAWSTDKGRTFRRLKTPVLANPNPAEEHFRDPKVFWDGGSKHWVMVLAENRHIGFYRSPNLRDWATCSKFAGGGSLAGSADDCLECPDLFPLHLDGGDGPLKWVLVTSVCRGGPHGGAAMQYWVGDFNTTRGEFTPDAEFQDRPPRWLDCGKDNYAAMTWEDAPGGTDFRLGIGWMYNPTYCGKTPATDYRGSMTIPRELQLRSSDGVMRLVAAPVAALQDYRDKLLFQADDHEVQSEEPLGGPAGEVRGRALDISCVLDLTAPAQEVGFRLHGARNADGKQQEVVVGYDRQAGRLFVDRSRCGFEFPADPVCISMRLHGDGVRICVRPGMLTAPLRPRSNQLDLRIILDHTSVEVFADGGATVMTCLTFPKPDSESVSVYAEGGVGRFGNMTVHRLSRRKHP